MMQVATRLPIAAMIACLVAITAVHAAPFKREDVYEAFFKTAYGVETMALSQTSGTFLRKFAGTVIYLIEADSEDHALLVRQALARISWGASIPMEEAESFEAANYFVYVYPLSERAAKNREIMARHGYGDSISPERLAQYDAARCRFSVFPDPAGTRFSIVFLAYESLSDLQYCMAEELVQAFGLVNDTDDVPHTVMNDTRDYPEVTNFDLHLLRMLYDSLLEPGMSAAQVREAAGTLLPRATRRIASSQPDLHVCVEFTCREPE